MKSKERHHLKENEFAATTAQVVAAFSENRTRVMVIAGAALAVVVAVGAFSYSRNSQADRAGEMLGAALAISGAPIAPPSTLPGATTVPGTYPTLKARNEAALKAFQDVAAAYPSTDAGLTANYHAAGELLSLGRLPEAEALFNAIVAANSPVYSPMARLGLAQVRLASGKLDDAVKIFTDLSGDRDSSMPVDGVLMQLAQAYVKAGKLDDARAAYKRVVDEFAESVYVPDARQRLTALN